MLDLVIAFALLSAPNPPQAPTGCPCPTCPCATGKDCTCGQYCGCPRGKCPGKRKVIACTCKGGCTCCDACPGRQKHKGTKAKVETRSTKCKTCDGTGTISEYRISQDPNDQQRLEYDCPDCRGTGKVKVKKKTAMPRFFPSGGSCGPGGCSPRR